jgi:hypothetical protein
MAAILNRAYYAVNQNEQLRKNGRRARRKRAFCSVGRQALT